MPSAGRSSSTKKPLHCDDGDTKAVITDALSVMMNQERTTYACHDYLTAPKTYQASSSDKFAKITASDRQRVIDWCYNRIDQCHFNRETIAVAMNLADRFMCIPSRKQIELLYHRGQYQLLIVTALYVAIKMNEPITFSRSADFAAVTHDTYSATELEEMEKTLLHGLEWRCSVPTPQQIGMHILELLKLHLLTSEVIQPSSPTWELLQEELAFQTQNAVRDYCLTNQRSSSVAAISLLNAIEQVNDVEYGPLMRTLIDEVLKKFEFEDVNTLLYLRLRLNESDSESDSEYFEEESLGSTRSCESDEAMFEDDEDDDGRPCDHQQEDDEVSLDHMSLADLQEEVEVAPQDCICGQDQSVAATVPLKSREDTKSISDINTCKTSLVTEESTPNSTFSQLHVRALENDDCSMATTDD